MHDINPDNCSPPVSVEITASIKNWALVDLGKGDACITGNIYGDTKQRFEDGDFIRTSKFRLACHPEAFKQGEMVRTAHSVYLLDEPWQPCPVTPEDVVVEVAGVSGSIGGGFHGG